MEKKTDAGIEQCASSEAGTSGFTAVLTKLEYHPHNKNPWETGVDRFSKDLQSALGRRPLVLSLEELVTLAAHYGSQFDCYWSTFGTQFSKECFAVTFVERGRYTGELQFQGFFDYDSASSLAEYQRLFEFDAGAVGIEGLFQTKFLGLASGAWSCIFNQSSLAERASSGRVTLVQPKMLESVILSRKNSR